MTCAHGVAPILLPLTNVSISSNGYTQTRGIQTGIGSPSQVFALWPDTILNNMLVSNSVGCSSATNYTCYGMNGGSFNTDKSSTYNMMTLAQWNGSHDELEEARLDSSFIYFQDSVRLSDNSLLPGFPIAMTPPNYPTQGVIGLAPDSPFLATLSDQNIAPSRAWGYWAGSVSLLEPRDGLLVIGGYDHARIAKGAKFTNFTSDPGYLGDMTAQVTNMTYDAGNGPVSLFKSSSQAFTAILNSASGSNSLPEEVFYKFGNITNANINEGTDVLSWPSSDPPNGNLTITLDDGGDGYKYEVPFYELFLQQRKYNDQGSMVVKNESFTFTSTANAKVLSSGVPWLGFSVFQSNYMVNRGDGTFQLAPVNRSDAYQISYPNGVDIRPICNETALANAGGGSSGSGGGGGGGGSSLSGGAIAGIVIGCIAGVALVAGAVGFWFLRRRRQQRQAQQAASAAGGGASGVDPSGKAELDPQSSVAPAGASATGPAAPPVELAHEDAMKVELPAGSTTLKPKEMVQNPSDTATVSTLPEYSRQEMEPVEMPANNP